MLGGDEMRYPRLTSSGLRGWVLVLMLLLDAAAWVPRIHCGKRKTAFVRTGDTWPPLSLSDVFCTYIHPSALARCVLACGLLCTQMGSHHRTHHTLKTARRRLVRSYQAHLLSAAWVSYQTHPSRFHPHSHCSAPIILTTHERNS